MLPPVPSEDKFVEISAEVRLSKTVVGAEPPPLEVREDAVNLWQNNVGSHVADHLCPVPVVLKAAVGRQPIADDHRAGFDDARNEPADAGRGEIGQRL